MSRKLAVGIVGRSVQCSMAYTPAMPPTTRPLGGKLEARRPAGERAVRAAADGGWTKVVVVGDGMSENTETRSFLIRDVDLATCCCCCWLDL